MKRASIATAASALLLTALVPAAATAKVIELGATASPLVPPTCPPGVTPANCTIVLTGVTALATVRDGHAYPTTVTQPGYIVAFTLGLSGLSTDRAAARNDIHLLNSNYGGATRARITVLKPVGKARLRTWAVTAQSPIFRLQPYLGQVVQFPLPVALPVTRGETVALTVPTWAPVLSISLPTKKFAYRQSRLASTICTSPSITDQTQSRIGKTAIYGCNYPGTRVEYSATEVTTPPIPKNYVRAGDRGK
jgi:hypothetical protein